MARNIILSNGSLLVGINRYGLVHDFYYPYVGVENHSSARTLRHRIGVWVDGVFSWLDDDSWEFSFAYEAGQLVGRTRARHTRLAVELRFRDAVDTTYDVFMREIEVVNLAHEPRQIRLMLHQAFKINNSNKGDTVQYLPHEEAILQYLANCHFIIKARLDTEESFDQYSVGLTGIEGKEGTYKDAEDGELEGNSVEHGNVDSVVRCCLDIKPQAARIVKYWIGCATTTVEAIKQSDAVSANKFEERFNTIKHYWHNWLKPAHKVAAKLPQERAQQFLNSLMLIKAHSDHRGSVIASADTQMLNYARDAYAYCWPRDAIFALWPLVRLGYKREAVKFFDFVQHGLQPGGYLMHKYQADGSLGSSWHPYIHRGEPALPIQEDETAGVIFLMSEYYRVHQDIDMIARYYRGVLKPTAEFLCAYVDSKTKLPHASFDLWEEHYMTATFTVALVQRALRLAVELAEAVDQVDDALKWGAMAEQIHGEGRERLFNEERNSFYKGFLLHPDGEIKYRDVIDASSTLGAWMFGLFQPGEDKLSQAIDTLEETFDLKGEFKGLPRYENDSYNRVDKHSLGNPWFVTSLWLGRYYAASGQSERAEAVLEWTEQHMFTTGVLAEQISPRDGSPVSVAPLVWSQAEYVSLVLDLYGRGKEQKQVNTPQQPKA